MRVVGCLWPRSQSVSSVFGRWVGSFAVHWVGKLCHGQQLTAWLEACRKKVVWRLALQEVTVK